MAKLGFESKSELQSPNVIHYLNIILQAFEGYLLINKQGSSSVQKLEGNVRMLKSNNNKIHTQWSIERL